jgi:hypothetical protein
MPRLLIKKTFQVILQEQNNPVVLVLDICIQTGTRFRKALMFNHNPRSQALESTSSFF